ncbi:CehA/McbA family metallohydrolase [Paenibacillus thiaminolyticus]|uniref:CehA/McbA family metallohydrolase n=1 Tax=Paenibacillus thiaminolyticus TaxID=49283 RepID=A0AAP9DTJ5_PANTH|nr:CehA/McbA family metallohydrolase [Paenibacillus thiaminolyticus]MCY9533630.1 CehA/McbA family metallohydrolase [Paenibacillus thiaminolyticus]MCY9600852.1 CehA/McbA family metallohydrolase [Paenibacillus thiaminolyticus]MCY9607681.1 CehA/McbA family metallohydrolase [Paenibacillus thiaminolyticus]MCY9611480.1 CehA/McbA family metallohydrolase [Paenibacillus thiaminolyticus]MCY9617249.1 CehA/McbA family metallohydrolase [Paenibacillus thiaminolyticus]
MNIRNPYAQEGVWLRGSFHNHTTNSDGHHPLATVYRMYHDYDFLGISDHDQITPHAVDSPIPTLFEAIEVSSPQAHMLLLQPPETLMEHYSNEFTIENYGRLSSLCLENGGISVLVHPNRFFSQYWKFGDMLRLPEYTGIEVINGDGHPQYDIAFDKWDALLSSGRQVWGFGNDDFHAYGQERRAWNMVYARENSREAVLSAIRQGSFYVSTGYGFDSIRVEGTVIVADLLSDVHLDGMYKYASVIGKDGRVLHEQTGRFKQIVYECTGNEQYVRLAVYLEGGFGAFSQPLFLSKGEGAE